MISVCVYYTTEIRQRAEQKFSEIVNQLNGNTCRGFNQNQDSWLYRTNDFIIYLLPLRNTRGRKFNKVYIPEEIDMNDEYFIEARITCSRGWPEGY